MGNWARSQTKENSRKIIRGLKIKHRSVEEPRLINQGTVLLNTKSLSKSFNGIQALQSLDLEIYEGEILGLLGPNGSGKSTFINVISGHYSCTSGQVDFLGESISTLSAHEIAMRAISRTYQTPRPFNELTVYDNLN